MAQKRRKTKRRPRQPQTRQGRLGPRVLGLAAVAGILLVVFAAYWALQPRENGAEPDSETASQAADSNGDAETVVDTTAGVASTGEKVVDPAREEADGAEHVVLPPEGSQPGATAPDFTLTSLAGDTVSLSDYRGKPAFVTFFHSW